MSNPELEQRLAQTEAALCTLIDLVEDKLRIDPWDDRYILNILTGYQDCVRDKGEEDESCGPNR